MVTLAIFTIFILSFGFLLTLLTQLGNGIPMVKYFGWVCVPAYVIAYMFAIQRAVAFWVRLREKILMWQGPGLPGDLSLLILRSPGDEASLALASVGFFNLTSRFLWALLTIPYCALRLWLGQFRPWFWLAKVPRAVLGVVVKRLVAWFGGYADRILFLLFVLGRSYPSDLPYCD